MGYVVGTLMTGTTTEGILEGKPEEEVKKNKRTQMLGCGDKQKKWMDY